MGKVVLFNTTLILDKMLLYYSKLLDNALYHVFQVGAEPRILLKGDCIVLFDSFLRHFEF